MILLLHICIICLIRKSFSEIIVKKNFSNETEEIFADLPALFGPPLPFFGLRGLVVTSSPPDGCTTITPPPKVSNYKGAFIVLIRRYNCSFVDKVLNAQQAGYQGVIVRNVGSNNIESMSGDHDVEFVQIPSVFVGQEDGLTLEINYTYNTLFHVVIVDDFPINIQDYLIPFGITIGICLVLMLIFMIVKWVRDYKQSRRHRLSSRSLKKIPIHKFKKGDPYECCAICLDEYVDNEKLRILPCSHAYHAKCIDPWLTKNRRVCPVCKRKVITGDENPSDLDTDSEDEMAPLIEAGNNTQGGTFNQQRENPFRWAERQLERRRHNRMMQRLHEQESSSSSEEERDQDDEPLEGDPDEYSNVVNSSEIPEAIITNAKELPEIIVVPSNKDAEVIPTNPQPTTEVETSTTNNECHV